MLQSLLATLPKARSRPKHHSNEHLENVIFEKALEKLCEYSSEGNLEKQD